MSNQLLVHPERAIPNPNLLSAFAEVDDDENDAVADDDDDEETVASSQTRWFSRAGFGSPEWWAHS